MSSTAILQVEHLSKHFGGLAALNDVSVQVERGARQAIIGPNGAGKSTLFNLIAGELVPTKGQVYLQGRDVTALPVHTRANFGLGRTFQRNNLFFGLSAFENVRLAVQHRRRLNRELFRAADKNDLLTRESHGLLQRVGLGERADQIVRTLAYGEQRALEIALALATEPQMLLLDEPTAGMSPAETTQMVRLIESLPRALTLLVVEHDMDVVFSLADRITVLHYGQIIADGKPNAVRANPLVQEIYLGVQT